MNSQSISIEIELKFSIKGEMIVNLKLLNHLDRTLDKWDLRFNINKEITAGQNTCVLNRTGTLVCIAPIPKTAFPRDGVCCLQLLGDRSLINRFSDLPRGFYIYSDGEYHEVSVTKDNLTELTASKSTSVNHTANRRIDNDAHTTLSATTEFNESNRPDSPTISIVPIPQQVKFLTGFFVWPKILNYLPLAEANDAIKYLSRKVGPKFSIEKNNQKLAQVVFILDSSMATEAYHLKIDTKIVKIYASNTTGFFYAAVSLVQLVATNNYSTLKLPCVEISDWPRFEYRGLMLDCARHFYDTSTVLHVLDLMAEYKLNHFHWHLTDDEGWRIEIKAFPELTEIGASRGAAQALKPQYGGALDGYSGYYTQEDIRIIVAYAHQLQITVIPEIDIPGHSLAAIKSLPALLVEPEDQSNYYSVQMYKDNVLNPGLLGTYVFLYTVLDEICELFPGPYVHIGADEVPDGVWQKSPACQALMQQFGYQNKQDLQNHLLLDVQKYLTSKNRQLIGWEEAIQGEKLDCSAIVCAWTNVDTISSTAELGYRVIACSAQFTYLDLAWDSNINEPGYEWAGTCNLQQCYNYEPQGEGKKKLSDAQLFGLQAQLWSEIVTNKERMEYMLFPRLLAIAETAWSSKHQKKWPSFSRRAEQNLKYLAKQGVNHHPI